MSPIKKQYILFCEKEKGIPLSSQSWHLDAVCGTNNWDVLMLKKGQEVAVTMPFVKTKKLGFTFSRMPRLTKYLGPYFTKKFRTQKQQQKLTLALLQELPAFDFFEQSMPISTTNALPFHWKNFKVEMKCTFIINLQISLPEIFNNISSNYRNNKIASAEKNIQISSARSLSEFYTVQQKTFTRQGLSMPFSLDFFQRYDQVLAEKNARKIFFAVGPNNQIHSVLYLTWDDQTAYLHMTGDDPGLRKSGAGILLIWHSIKYAKTILQKKYFDFEGSMIEPIAKVRQDFGGVQASYFHIKKYNSKLIKTLHQLKP